MRFRTRAFLFSFVPFALLLTFSFWMIQRMVQSAVRGGLRTSLRENHLAIARARAKSDLQNNRFLRIAGENPALKAGIQLLRFESASNAARRTVEDQLAEMCANMGFDFLLVSAPDGVPLAGVVRSNGSFAPIAFDHLDVNQKELLLLDGHTFQLASVPIDQGEENIGALSVGEYFNFSEFTTAAVLIHRGTVVNASLPGASLSELNAVMAQCDSASECEFRLRGVSYISLPMQSASFGSAYVLRSLQNVDSVVGPVLTAIRGVFLPVSFGAVLIASLCGALSARTIVKPIGMVVSHLHDTARTGELPEFHHLAADIPEIRDLKESFNRAAVSVRDARDGLRGAYVQFVQSLASALDARDRYTAGHSERVSGLSCRIAQAIDLPPAEVENIRVGALLHDIGKIGIGDHLLQKPGRLTAEETAIIQRHPEIGRKILEGVHGFAPYLNAVELHHENWDGTGYPHGQAGEQTPLDARIIHVADAFDAMTTDRPYKAGIRREKAIEILRVNAGTQFDPLIVEAFIMMYGYSTAVAV